MEAPRFAQIEPVGQCNLRCQMCPIQYRRDGPPALLDFDLYTRILDQLPALEELHLQGLGEPLMHPRFFDMVRLAAARRIRVTTNTNLTLLGPRRAAQCATSGLACLHVSLDGATAATYERIRIRGRFHRVLRNLKHLAAACRESPSPPEICLVCVVMRQNLHEIPGLVRLAHRLGVPRLFVQHLCHDYGEPTLPGAYDAMRHFVAAETLQGEDRQRIEQHFRHARAAAEELSIDLRLPRIEPRPHPAGTRGPDRCNWPWHGPYISYDGRVMPCCMIATPDRQTLGDLRREKLDDVWNGPAYAKFRQQLDSDTPPDVCRGCAVYQGTF